MRRQSGAMRGHAANRADVDRTHAQMAQNARRRGAELGMTVASGRHLSDLPPYASVVAARILTTAEPCEHLEAADRDGATDPGYAFADEPTALRCAGCMRLRADARATAADDGSACDLCGTPGLTYVVVAGIVVVAGALCEGCQGRWHVPAPRSAAD